MKKDAGELVSKVIANAVDSRHQMAENDTIVLGAIGAAVCKLLSEAQTLTFDALVDMLETDVTNSSSARGQMSPDLDLKRMRAEAAIKRLQSFAGREKVG